MKPVIHKIIQQARACYDGYPQQKVVQIDAPRHLGNYISYKGFRESICSQQSSAKSIHRDTRYGPEQYRANGVSLERGVNDYDQRKVDIGERLKNVAQGPLQDYRQDQCNC